ncbi:MULTISPECIES: hypothetical protein [unclassified Moorena]|uniref:hypothetical protein n=1 Tax=unclassified Moorena TaxID=2683338 RepID=UPI0013CD0B07|nr:MULTISPECIES: hypothetical protein [unclassified Moorena]NEO21363.1 hypothetical protein [Moorena sp. SIO4A5]NEQ61718.1 hypothetical protein [Moorena sp. SIO4A1]
MGRWGDGEIGGRESCRFDPNLVLKPTLQRTLRANNLQTSNPRTLEPSNPPTLNLKL